MRKARVVLVSGLVAASVAFGGIGPTGAAAAPAASSKPAGALSARLRTLGSIPQRQRSTAAASQQLGLPAEGPGSLVRPGPDVVEVEARVTNPDGATVTALRNAGAVVVHVSARWRTVTLATPIGALAAVAAVPGVEWVSEVLRPRHDATGVAHAAAVPAAGSDCGSVHSEGDAQIRADTARAMFGVDGTGVTVGILSDSYDRSASVTTAGQDVATGDLPGVANPCGHPTPVAVVDDAADPDPNAAFTDEGRGMLQLVHDVAPGAALSFATANRSLTSFADNVTALAATGADVVVDDVAYFSEPFYQDGPVGVAYGQAKAAGVLGVTAAGNGSQADSLGRQIGSTEAPAFRAMGCPSAVANANPTGTRCHDFNPGAGTDNTMRVVVAPGRTLVYDLQWAQPWEGVTTDIDVFILDSAGNVLAGSDDDNLASQRPFEFVGVQNTSSSPLSVDVVVVRFNRNDAGSSLTPRFKLISEGDTPVSIERPTSANGDVVGPTVAGHAASPNVLSVAATAFDDGVRAESYSSAGPATFLFGPVQPVGAAPALAAPQVLHKPDVTATDGGATTFFFPPGPPYRFYGTSAAGPHAAGAAALILDKAPGTSPTSVASLLTTTARPMTGGIDSVGTGLIDATAAVAATPEPPVAVIAETPTAALLPVGAAVLAAGAIVVGRRRRPTRSRPRPRPLRP